MLLVLLEFLVEFVAERSIVRVAVQRNFILRKILQDCADLFERLDPCRFELIFTSRSASCFCAAASSSFRRCCSFSQAAGWRYSNPPSQQTGALRVSTFCTPHPAVTMKAIVASVDSVKNFTSNVLLYLWFNSLFIQTTCNAHTSSP